MSRYRSILFDLDGTLVDSAPGIRHAFLESARLVLPETSLDLPDIRPYIGPPLPEMVRLLLPGASAPELERVVAGFRSVYDDSGWRKTGLFETVIETLSRLRDLEVRCFLATSKRLVPTMKIMEGLGLLPFFEDVISSDASHPVRLSKESMVRDLVARHRLDPSRTLMVGDTGSDAAAARACGLDFALAAYGYGGEGAGPDTGQAYVLLRLSDLLPVLSGEAA